MRTFRPRIYFGRADLQMTPFQGLSQFRRSLLTSMLFFGDLVITDGFWFMSKHLLRELLRDPENNLLVAGLELGLIRPWFREDVGGSFQRAYEAILDQGVVGMVDDSFAAANILERVTQGAETYRHGLWPKCLVGGRFLKEVRNDLQEDEPAIMDSLSREAWTATEVWRTDCVDKALQRSSDGTLRRGELLDVVARTAGWSLSEKVPNATVALLAARGGNRRLLKAFICWVNRCYQRNQAHMFRASAAVVSGSGLEQLTLFPARTLARRTCEMEVMKATVPIPAISLLCRLDARSVLASRFSPEGEEYFRRLGAWSKTPSSSNRDELLGGLEHYAKRLCRDFFDRTQKAARERLAAYLPSLPPKERAYWVGQARRALGLVPHIGGTLVLTDMAWAAFKHHAPDTSARVRHGMERLVHETPLATIGARTQMKLIYKAPAISEDSREVISTVMKGE